MSALAIAERDTEPAPRPEPAICLYCCERLPAAAAVHSVAHADCDRPPSGTVLWTGAFAELEPQSEGEREHREAAKRGELIAELGRLWDEHGLDDLAFGIRVLATDEEQIERLRALIAID